MTNREWLMEQMQNMSDEEFATKLEDFCRDNADICKIMHNECEDIGDCTDCAIKWLKAEHEEVIKLTEAERVILENIDKKYKYICRDLRDNDLQVSVTPLKKVGKEWAADNMEREYIHPFNHLFQFIKWEDENPYEIAELLKGE